MEGTAIGDDGRRVCDSSQFVLRAAERLHPGLPRLWVHGRRGRTATRCDDKHERSGRCSMFRANTDAQSHPALPHGTMMPEISGWVGTLLLPGPRSICKEHR